MGTNTLTDKVGGATIVAADVNDIHTALKDDVVPRNSSGVPTDLGGSLGTPSLRWEEGRFENVFVSGTDISKDTLAINKNDIISGFTRTTSEQPAFLDPIGSAGGLQFDVLATTTNLIYDVAGNRFTVTSDLTHSFLGAAPATNNTALVDDIEAVDQISTRTWGELLAEKESITIDSAGTEITSRIGSFQAFEIDNGSQTEIFLSYINSATELNSIRRGWFYDSSANPIKRIVFSNNDTITLLITKWVFLNKDLATVTLTENNPSWSGTEPTTPAAGDYWHDLENKIWKRYNGSIFIDSESTLIGMVIVDTADCIAARSEEFGRLFDIENSFEFTKNSATIIKSNYGHNRININGQVLRFGVTLPTWDITTDLAPSVDLYNATEQASTRYYLYMTEFGETKISDFEPIFRYDMSGFYHPNNPWRCLGYAFNDSSSDFDWLSWFSPFTQEQETDIFQSFSTAAAAITTSTYVTLGLTTPSLSFGSAIKRTGDTLQFTKRGFYEITLRLGGGLTSTADTDFDARIRNTTASNTLHSFSQVAFKGFDNPKGNVTWSNVVKITDLFNSTYEFQASVVTGTADWNINKTEVSIRRLKGLHV